MRGQNHGDNSQLTASIQHWLLGLVLSLGGAIVWMLTVSYVLSWINVWGTWFVDHDRSYEVRSVSLRKDGEPIVSISRGRRDGQQIPVEYQTLDGQPVVRDPDELTRQTRVWSMSTFSPTFSKYHAAGYHSSAWLDVAEPLPWTMGIPQFLEDNQYPGTGRRWFFRWPRHPGGSGYFEGFDERTKARFGYLGLNGFSETVPPLADQFPAWDPNKSATAAFVNSSPNFIFPPPLQVLSLNEAGEPKESGLWYVSPKRDRISVINLTRRTVGPTRVLTGEKLLGTALQEEREERQQIIRFMLVWEDRLEFVSPTLKTLREVPVPAELRGKLSSPTELESGEFETAFWDMSPNPRVTPPVQHFVRFNDRGEVTLRRDVPLQQTGWSPGWTAELLVAPVSLMPLAAVPLLMPARFGLVMDDTGQQIRKPDEPLTWSLQLRAYRAYGRSLGWPLAVCLLSGLPFAVLCAWRQHRLPVTNFDRAAWPLLLCVFGIVGWIAFLTHRRWPARRITVASQEKTHLATA